MAKIYPFKFLDAYDEKDTKIFFGREDEIKTLYEMLFQTNIILVYGASGTGKTSLIQCGLAKNFQPHEWLAINIRRGNNLNNSFEDALARAGGNNDIADTDDELDAILTGKKIKTTAVKKELSDLEKSFRAIYVSNYRPIYLIFDQFEELFIIGKKEEQDLFIEKIQKILTLEQPIKIIFSIREEYLGYLYKFEKEVPQLMRKKLRVEPMHMDKVKQIIEGVAKSEETNITVAKDNRSKVGELIFETVRGEDNTLTIQLPYLQVFLDKLYQNTRKDKGKVPAEEAKKNLAEAEFTEEAIRNMGNMKNILREFLDEQVKNISDELSTPERILTTEDTWNILSPFATAEGTKKPTSQVKLEEELKADYAPELVEAVLGKFVTCRILRQTSDKEIYELAHDTLAKQVAANRTEEERELMAVKKIITQRIDENEKEKEDEGLTEKQLARANNCNNKKFTEAERKFIETSDKKIKIKRLKRRAIIATGISAIVAALIFMTFMYFKAQKTLDKLKEEKAHGIAKELINFGDSYRDNGNYAYALESYMAARDSLTGFEKDTLYEPLNRLVNRFTLLDSAYKFKDTADKAVHDSDYVTAHSYYKKGSDLLDKIKPDLPSNPFKDSVSKYDPLVNKPKH